MCWAPLSCFETQELPLNWEDPPSRLSSPLSSRRGLQEASTEVKLRRLREEKLWVILQIFFNMHTGKFAFIRDLKNEVNWSPSDFFKLESQLTDALVLLTLHALLASLASLSLLVFLVLLALLALLVLLVLIDYITKHFLHILSQLGVNLCKRGSVINLKHQLTGYRMYWYISAYKSSQILLNKIIHVCLFDRGGGESKAIWAMPFRTNTFSSWEVVFNAICGLDGIGMELMVIIGHRSSKSTLGANKRFVPKCLYIYDLFYSYYL